MGVINGWQHCTSVDTSLLWILSVRPLGAHITEVLLFMQNSIVQILFHHTLAAFVRKTANAHWFQTHIHVQC